MEKQPSGRKKVKKEIVLLNQDDKLIYQSNRLTNGRFKGFTLIQGKILTCIINELQLAIKHNMSGANWQQLSLFEEPEKNIFKITVPMSMIGHPRQYNEIQKSAREMLNLVAEIKAKEGNKEDVAFVLFHKVGTPTKENKKNL